MNQPTSTKTPPWLFRFEQQLTICQRRMKTLHHKKFWHSSAPWTLILGPDKSGKSSLLNALQCQHISTQDESHETTPFDWWINHSAYFLVGDLETIDQQEEKYSLWEHTLPLLKKTWSSNTLQRIILIIDLPTLCLSEEQSLQSLYQTFNKHLTKLQKLSPHSTIDIAINHCDRIIGLKEYTQEQKTSDTEQTFGITLHKKNRLTHFDALFHQERNHFIQAINHDVIALCQPPMPRAKRKELLQLPFQLDALLLRIKQFINPLSDSLKKQIHSVCFCASEQRHQAINATTPYLKKIITPIHSNPIQSNESYTPLFLNADHFAQIRPARRIINPLRVTAYFNPLPTITTLALCLGVITLYHIALQHGYNITKQTYHALQGIQNQAPDNTTQNDLAWINSLQKDQTMLQMIHHSGALKYQWIGIHPLHQLYQQISEHYHITQQSDFIPYAYSLLVESLNQPTKSSEQALYQGLEIFLMMTGQHLIDQERVISWYQYQWEKAGLPQPTINTLSEQIIILLKHHNTPWPTNAALVESTRQTLLQHPISVLALLKQESLTLSHTVPIANSTSSILTKNSLLIPYFYTEQQKEKIHHLTLTELLHTLNDYDWVVKTDVKTLSEGDKKNLLADTQARYQDNFQRAWRNVLSHLSFKTPKTIQELNALTSQLNNPQSAFYKALQIIQSHANQTSLDINRELPVSDGTAQPDWGKDLSSMTSYTNTILNSSNPDLNAFQHAVKSIKEKKQAPGLLALKSHFEDAPTLLQPALTLVIKGYWDVMLNASREYINAQWGKTVIPLYKASINNRFPIFYPSKKDISAKDFNTFFGPQGAIDSFFNEYLAPFVNASGYYWTWKKIDGHTLSSSQHALDMIIRASVIQQMFYNGGQPNPSESFALALKNHSKNITSISISIDDHTTQLKTNDNTIHKFTSANTASSTALITIKGQQGTDSLHTSGNWPWLRMIHLGTLKTTSDANQFFLSFQTDNYQVQFGLIAKNKQNPYLPGVLSAFRCPKEF